AAAPPPERQSRAKRRQRERRGGARFPQRVSGRKGEEDSVREFCYWVARIPQRTAGQARRVRARARRASSHSAFTARCQPLVSPGALLDTTEGIRMKRSVVGVVLVVLATTGVACGR